MKKPYKGVFATVKTKDPTLRMTARALQRCLTAKLNTPEMRKKVRDEALKKAMNIVGVRKDIYTGDCNNV